LIASPISWSSQASLYQKLIENALIFIIKYQVGGQDGGRPGARNAGRRRLRSGRGRARVKT
jgi:hypothetical protein